jgi:hypothetical protein
MALHDFYCQTCGQVLLDVPVPIAIGATAGAPIHCDRPATWLPAVGRMDAANGPTFRAFEAYDGANRPVLIDSLTKLRAVERDSQAMAANGEGQPIIWRRYAQDHSNRDVHALVPHPQYARPDPAWVAAHRDTIRRGDTEATDIAYGPGVSDASPCALDALEK